MKRMKTVNEIVIDTEYVTLGQFLKMVDIIGSGGQAKWYLAENDVFVNDELEGRRGRKLRHEDIVELPEVGKFIVKDAFLEE